MAGDYLSALVTVGEKYWADRQKYDPKKDLLTLTETFKDTEQLIDTFSQLLSYQLFIKKNVIAALPYVKQIVLLDPQISCLKVHNSLFLFMDPPVNLLEVLCNDIRLAIMAKAYSGSEERSQLREAVAVLVTRCSEMTDAESPTNKLKELILSKSNILEAENVWALSIEHLNIGKLETEPTKEDIGIISQITNSQKTIINTELVNELQKLTLDDSQKAVIHKILVQNMQTSLSVATKQLILNVDVLKEQLDVLETPFNWRPSKVPPQDTPEAIIAQVTEKMEEIDDNEEFKWRSFILDLVLCYEHDRQGNATTAMTKVLELDRVLSQCPSSAWLFSSIADALWNVVLGCKAHLTFKAGILSETKQLLSLIKRESEMSESCRAAVYGIKCGVYLEYGHKGNMEGVGWAKKAIEICPDEAEWHFLFGKALGRIRRVIKPHEEVPHEELKALEKAANLTKNASHLIFLAQVYRETAFRIFKMHHSEGNFQGSNLGSVVKSMNEKSQTLYKKAMGQRPNCAHMMIRCAFGMLKLPYYFRDLELAKELITKALEKAPNNSMVNHVAGIFYHRHNNDVQRGMHYLDIACKQRSYGAAMELIQLKFNLDTTIYDPIRDLLDLLPIYQELPRVIQTITQLGSYQLFIKIDVLAAIPYFDRIIREDPETSSMRAHKSLFLNMKDPIDLYKILCNDVRVTLHHEKRNGFSEELLKLREMAIMLKTLCPEEMNENELPSLKLKKMLIKDSEEIRKKRSRYSEKGRGRGRGRSTGRGRGRGIGEVNHGRGHGYRGRGDGYHGGGAGGERGAFRHGGNRFRDSSASSVDSDYQRDSSKPFDRDYERNVQLNDQKGSWRGCSRSRGMRGERGDFRYGGNRFRDSSASSVDSDYQRDSSKPFDRDYERKIQLNDQKGSWRKSSKSPNRFHGWKEGCAGSRDPSVDSNKSAASNQPREGFCHGRAPQNSSWRANNDVNKVSPLKTELRPEQRASNENLKGDKYSSYQNRYSSNESLTEQSHHATMPELQRKKDQRESFPRHQIHSDGWHNPQSERYSRSESFTERRGYSARPDFQDRKDQSRRFSSCEMYSKFENNSSHERFTERRRSARPGFQSRNDQSERFNSHQKSGDGGQNPKFETYSSNESLADQRGGKIQSLLSQHYVNPSVDHSSRKEPSKEYNNLVGGLIDLDATKKTFATSNAMSSTGSKNDAESSCQSNDLGPFSSRRSSNENQGVVPIRQPRGPDQAERGSGFSPQ